VFIYDASASVQDMPTIYALLRLESSCPARASFRHRAPENRPKLVQVAAGKEGRLVTPRSVNRGVVCLLSKAFHQTPSDYT
jgi:hypothetical protein